MKSTKIIYWVTTSIICLFASTGIFFMNSEMAIKGTEHLEIPRYLSLEVSIGQFIGMLLLIIPAVPARFKEWAYVGFGILYLTALNAHLAVGDTIAEILMPVLFFGLLLTSYLSYHKLRA